MADTNNEIDNQKNNFKRKKILMISFAVGLALALGLTVFLLTLFCPPVAFVVAGTLTFIGLEAVAGFATLSIAAIAGGLIAGASLFLSLLSNLSFAVKDYFYKHRGKSASNVKCDDLPNLSENSSSNMSGLLDPKKMKKVEVTAHGFENQDEVYQVWKKKDCPTTHDEFTFKVPAFGQNSN